MKITSVLALLTLIGLNSKAQLPVGGNKLVPSVKLGYTFRAGITIGLEARYTFNSENPVTQTGLFASKSWVRYHQSWQSLYANGLFIEKPDFQVAAGIGKTKKKWGFNKRNSCKVYGIYADAGYILRQSPMAYTAGLRTFWYKESKYRWFTGDFYIPYFGGSIIGKSEKP